MKGQKFNGMISSYFDSHPSIHAFPLEAHHFIIHLTKVMDEPSFFDDVISCLATASENDLITFNINNKGGFVDSLISLKGWIGQTKAKVINVLSGEASSAASAFFLQQVDEYHVVDGSRMMIHEFQYGNGGTASNVKKAVDFTHEENRKFVEETYKGFLTPEEINAVLNGAEIYLNDVEIKDRLTKREELRKKEFQEMLNNAIDKAEDLSQYATEDLEVELEEVNSYIKDLKTELKKREKTLLESVDKEVKPS